MFFFVSLYRYVQAMNSSRNNHEKVVNELEDTLSRIRSIVATKDKAVSILMKETKQVEDQLSAVEA